MAPLRKKNCSGRSQLRRRRVRFPISSSFCFRQGLFLPRLLPLPVPDFHRRAETMAPMRKKNCSGRSQLRRRRMRFPISSSFCFRRGLFLPRLPVSETRAPIRKNCSRKSQLRQSQKMEEWVSNQRAELMRAKESVEKHKGSVEKDKAAAEERAVELAECRRLIELHEKEDARNKCFIALTLAILDARDQGDFTRAELLEHSWSELLAEMEKDMQAFMNAGGSLDS